MFIKTTFVLALYTSTSLFTACKTDFKPNVNAEKINPTTNIDRSIAHIDKRFNDLETILNKSTKYTVRFPGSRGKHALGTGIAKSAWGDGPEHQKLVNHIQEKITALENKFPHRIFYGFIGDYRFDADIGGCDANFNNRKQPGSQSDGSFLIDVWGANSSNFNLDDGAPGPWGSGQATCFSHQRPGVFGISTMPEGSFETLMAKDKLIDKY